MMRSNDRPTFGFTKLTPEQEKRFAEWYANLIHNQVLIPSSGIRPANSLSSHIIEPYVSAGGALSGKDKFMQGSFGASVQPQTMGQLVPSVNFEVSPEAGSFMKARIPWSMQGGLTYHW